jgi:hypothetical protein
LADRENDNTIASASSNSRTSARLADKAKRLQTAFNKDGAEQSDESKVVVVEFDENSNYISKEVHFVYASALTLAFGEPDDYPEAKNGTVDAVSWFKVGVGKHFSSTEQGMMTKDLGIWYKWKLNKNDNKFVVLMKPKLMDEVFDSFTELTGKDPKVAKMPGTQGLILMKTKIVGKIPYLIAELMVEEANPARELAKHSSNLSIIHWMEEEGFVGFLKANKNNIRLTLRKPRELRSVVNVDSYTIDRRSVSKMILTIGGTITNHQSKTQRIVTLFSTSIREGRMLFWTEWENTVAYTGIWEDVVNVTSTALAHAPKSIIRKPGVTWIVLNANFHVIRQNLSKLQHHSRRANDLSGVDWFGSGVLFKVRVRL